MKPFVEKLAITDDNYIYFVEDARISLHIAQGAVDREKMISGKNIVTTSKDERVLLCEPTYKDQVMKMKRKAAMINDKDAGLILTATGLTKNSVVIDAGSGSGGIACRFGALVKQVYTYDIHKDHVKVVKENVEHLGLDNVQVEEGDIATTTPPEKADVVVLDVLDAKAVLANIPNLVKQGGYIALYQTQINQVQDTVTALSSDYKILHTVELMERKWVVDEKRLRPDHKMLGHTAFLTFIRYFGRE
jgi:tRNA (adenine57-N1/adenine58-N1)-methyltransferase